MKTMTGLILCLLLFTGCTALLAQNQEAKRGKIATIDMVTIPAGTFTMGYITGDGNDDEKPAHEVTITRPFLMGKTEVTQAQWKSVMGENMSNFKGDSLPVETVSWFDAVDYCNKLSKQEGLDSCYTGSGDDIVCDFTANGYRLPTEAEWEYACRGGTKTDYSTGDMTNPEGNDPSLNLAGWYEENCGKKTHNVGSKRANPFGLFDMHGNVWEWCWDWDSKYTASSSTDPRGPSSGSTLRVLRGGSWGNNALSCSSAYRYYSCPAYRYYGFGFRIVRIF